MNLIELAERVEAADMTAKIVDIDALIRRLQDPTPPHYGKCLVAADQLREFKRQVASLKREMSALRAKAGEG